MKKILIPLYICFAVVVVQGALNTPTGSTSKYMCGGVIIGFDSHHTPIPATPEYYKNHPRQIHPMSTGEHYSFVFDSSVDPQYIDYLRKLLTTVAKYIPIFYGDPPDPGLVITVKYDNSNSGWYFYNPQDNSITISGYPGSPYLKDDDGDGKIDEDPFNGKDDDGDGLIDEDYDNDPSFDAVLTHELNHSFHDDFGMFASWAEEGMNECSTELVAQYLYKHKIRDIRGRTPRVNLLYYDTWNMMGPDIMGGTLYSFYKSLPSLIYDSAPALFYMLCSSQANTFTEDLTHYTFLRSLNETIRNMLGTGGYAVDENQFYQAIDSVCQQPIDGILPASDWVKKQSVTNTTPRPGAFLGIYTAYATNGNNTYFTMVNPSFFNIFAFKRIILPNSNPWDTKETILTSDNPVYVSIYNCFGNLVWRASSDDGPFIKLSNKSGYNWIYIGHTENWSTGWYRIVADTYIDGFGKLHAENYFMVLGPEFNENNVLDSDSEGMALGAISGGGQTIPPDLLSAPFGTTFLKELPWVVLTAPSSWAIFPSSVSINLGNNNYSFTVPRPFTRVIPLHDNTRFIFDVHGAGDEYTGLSVTNCNKSTQNISFTWFSSEGMPIGDNNELSISLNPETQILSMASQLFGTQWEKPGWIEIASTQPIKSFFLNGDTKANYLDGTLSQGDVSTQILVNSLLVENGFDTTLSIVNPFDDDSAFVLILFDPEGSFLKTTNIYSIASKGQVQINLHDAFPDISLSNSDYLIIDTQGNPPLCASVSYSNGVSLATLPAKIKVRNLFPSSTGEIPTTLYSAQLAVGRGFDTILQITNNSEVDSTKITLSAFDENGNPLADDIIKELSPGQKLFMNASDTFNLQPQGSDIVDGWVKISSTSNLIQGSIFFGSTSGSFLSAQPLTSRALKRLLFGHIAYGKIGIISYFTGVALLNPFSATAHYKIIIHDGKTGEVLYSSDVMSLEGMHRISQMIEDYIPDIQPIFGGWIEISSDIPLVGYELFGDQGLNFLSAVPPMTTN